MHQLGLFLVRPKNNISFESNLNTSCILEYLYAKKKNEKIVLWKQPQICLALNTFKCHLCFLFERDNNWQRVH